MSNARRAMAALVVCGAMALLPRTADAQGLWMGGWGWGGPIGFGPAPVAYGFGPTYVSSWRTFGWGYPGFSPVGFVAPVPRPVVVAPLYGPVGPAFGGPVFVAPRARAVRFARRGWRWGYGW